MGEVQTDAHVVRGAHLPSEESGGGPSEQEGIGARLAKSGDDLLHCGQTLSTLVEPAGQTLVREAIGSLGKQVFRIVVVGQIKSGKSSFINAFVRQPSLLPTDVSPWTTTITNLHFVEPAPGNYAAAFQFFSEHEWQDLAEGGGRIRELTQRLVPDFEPELLRQHVDVLKRRAGARLGSEYEKLLGGTHYFENVSPDLLLLYCCSGDFAADTQASPLGKYADITKRADLYFEGGPFAFPVAVTDTPGTNDPFLIRDEITRRSLEVADLFIVVLSARQPLSESDLTLMRLMHGLNRDRIIAFVNRIDDFSDVGYDLAEVLIYVEKKLQAEFPGAQIPVVAGSAAWANCALRPDANTFNRLFERRSFGYLAELGLVGEDDLAPGAINDPVRRQHLCKALFAASGLPAMCLAVAGRMGASQAAHIQLQIARCFSEMTQASASSLRYELESLQEPGLAKPPTSKPQEEERAELEQKAKLLNDVALNVEHSAKNIEQQLALIIDEEMNALRGALQSAVNAHAENERQVLIDTLERGQAPRVWTHEGIELRRAMAKVFQESFNRAVSRVVEFQARVAPELHQLMGMIAPEIPMPTEPEKGMLEIPQPTIAALSRFVALDLDVSWWSGFWKGRVSPASYGDQIEALIKSEFQAVADELVRTVDGALSDYAANTTKWSFGLCLNIVQAVKRRREQMVRRCNSIEKNANAPMKQDAAREHEEHVGMLTEKLQRCGALQRRLDAIANELAAGLHPPSGLVT